MYLCRENAACAVCADTHAPGFGFSCHECEGAVGESAKAIAGVAIGVVAISVALILMDFTRRVGGEGGDDIEEGGPRTCKRDISAIVSRIVKSLPMTAIKTVIVVWQIITQVRRSYNRLPYAAKFSLFLRVRQIRVTIDATDGRSFTVMMLPKPNSLSFYANRVRTLTVQYVLCRLYSTHFDVHASTFRRTTYGADSHAHPLSSWLHQFAAIAGDTYPEVYEDFIAKLRFINVDLGFFLSSSCVVRTNFYHRLLFATISPLVILLVLGVTYHIAKKRNEGSQRALLAVKLKHLSAGLFIAFFIYSSVSFTIFQTFVCDRFDDGVRYLRADYSLTCSGTQYDYSIVFACVMVLVYPVGIPLGCFWWVKKHQAELRRADRETIATLKPFESIWSAYKPSRPFFEVVEFGRRVALTAVAVFVFPGSSAQIAIVLLLAVVFLFVSESLSPFSNSRDMGLYRWGNGIVLGSMYVALLLRFDVSEEEDHALSAFSGVLIAANVFMVITVIIQSYFMVKEWLQADKPMEALGPFASLRFWRSSSPDRDEVGEDGVPRSPAVAGTSAEPGKE